MKNRMQFHITTNTFEDRMLVLFFSPFGQNIDLAGLIYLHCDHSLIGGYIIPVSPIAVETCPDHGC
jgi:hypothetical protein